MSCIQKTNHVKEKSEVRSLHGGLHIAALEDNVGALAAELEGDSLQVGRGLRLDDLSDLGGAGEGHLVHLGMAGDGGTGRRSVPRDDVHDARREPGFLGQFAHVEPGQWSL